MGHVSLVKKFQHLPLTVPRTRLLLVDVRSGWRAFPDPSLSGHDVVFLALQVLQLYQITQINHGLMMVGPSGSGKSMAWRVLLKALERLEGVEGVAHIIDPKAISKDHLYGTLDPNTREWTDGLFTHVLRK